MPKQQSTNPTGSRGALHVVKGRNGWTVRDNCGGSHSLRVSASGKVFATRDKAAAYARRIMRQQRGQTPTGAQRRAEALRIAAKHGARVVRTVEKMDFSDQVTARQKTIAERLKGIAQRAVQNHGSRAA